MTDLHKHVTQQSHACSHVKVGEKVHEAATKGKFKQYCCIIPCSD